MARRGAEQGVELVEEATAACRGVARGEPSCPPRARREAPMIRLRRLLHVAMGLMCPSLAEDMPYSVRTGIMAMTAGAIRGVRTASRVAARPRGTARQWG